MKWTKQAGFSNYTSEDGKWLITKRCSKDWLIYRTTRNSEGEIIKEEFVRIRYTLKEAKTTVEALNK